MLGCSAFLFFTEAIPLPVTALLVPAVLVLATAISAETALSFFAHPIAVLFMAMFIIGEGTFLTGFAGMLVCRSLTAIATSFMSSTATATHMAPLAMPIAHATGISPLPFARGIAVSASACLPTPFAMLLCWLLIPLIWPFQP